MFALYLGITVKFLLIGIHTPPTFGFLMHLTINAVVVHTCISSKLLLIAETFKVHGQGRLKLFILLLCLSNPKNHSLLLKG